MALPKPEPGLVIRYDYLWLREQDAGRSAAKERPACIVATIDDAVDPRLVLMLPITHSPPRGETVGVEIPATVARSLGLSDERSWTVISEANVDHWPNPGLAPVPKRHGAFAYSYLPPDLFETIRSRFLSLVERRRARLVRR
jgi:hypothetical protein